MNPSQTGVNRPRVVVLNSPLIGQQYLLAGPVSVIGRSTDCQVQLDLVSISRRHASIEEQNGRFYVCDTGSRNGVKVADRKVMRTEVVDGDVITIGEVDLRFEMPEAVAPTPPASARALTGSDIMAVAQSGVGGAFAQGPDFAQAEQQQQAQQVMTKQREMNTKLGIAVVLGLVVAAVVSYVVFFRDGGGTEEQTGALQPALVMVGQQRIIPTHAKAGDFSRDAIEVLNSSIVDAVKYDERQLLITGKSVGETDIILRTKTSKRLTMRILVRGRLPNPLEDLVYAKLSNEQRLDAARWFVERGQLIEAEKPYLALQEYEKALAVMEPVPGKGELYLKTERRRDTVKTLLDAHWDRLRGDIKVAAKNTELPRVEELVQEALTYFPDPNDPRNQWAVATKLGVLNKILAEKRK